MNTDRTTEESKCIRVGESELFGKDLKHGKETTEREKYRGDFVGVGQQTAGIGGAVGVQTCGVEPDIPQICIRPLCRATR